MAKSSPEKLAAALRANLKRRKPPRGAKSAPSDGEPPPKSLTKSGKKPGFP